METWKHLKPRVTEVGQGSMIKEDIHPSRQTSSAVEPPQDDDTVAGAIPSLENVSMLPPLAWKHGNIFIRPSTAEYS